LGRIDLTIEDRKVTNSSVSFIDLGGYDSKDEDLAEKIAVYNDAPEFEVVVGYAETYHDRSELGCFYTEALMSYMSVDASFQNGGGIRADIDQGDITAMEIYRMDPFNNGSVIFTLTAGEVSDFFKETGTGLHVSGISFEPSGNRLYILDADGNRYADNDLITIGINDYIPSVHDSYFPLDKAVVQDLTTAETIIEYLKNNNTVDEEGCDQYYRY
jgi:2',3'-cyclic-nucleotide 2'-phosphodiesterase (5'-nucleotidase family)